MPQEILEYLQTQNPRYMLELAEWASIESCTDDREGLQTFAEVFATRARMLGLEVQHMGPGGARIHARWPVGADAPILMIVRSNGPCCAPIVLKPSK